MSAPRLAQFLPLRQLSKMGRHGPRQRRSLHMTEPKDYSPALSGPRPVSYLPADFAGLRAEARSRGLEHSGSKAELIRRLRADDIASSRSFTTAVAFSLAAEPPAAHSRSFNTSRALKAVADTSTLDFAYMPDFTHPARDTDADADADADSDSSMHSFAPLRMPIVPDLATPAPALAASAPADAILAPPVMKPQINSVSLDQIVLPMTELHDNAALDFDFTKFAATMHHAG